MDLETQNKQIPIKQSGRAMEAIELAGIDNPRLKSRIKQLIYWTYTDTIKAVEAFLKDETA